MPILMDIKVRWGIPEGKRVHLRCYSSWSRDIQPQTTYLSPTRLVAPWYWLLPASAALFMFYGYTRLLRWGGGGVENIIGQFTILVASWNALCPCQRRSPGRCLGFGADQVLHTGLQQPRHRHRPQASCEDYGGPYPWWDYQHSHFPYQAMYFDIAHCPGKSNAAADATSRHPVANIPFYSWPRWPSIRPISSEAHKWFHINIEDPTCPGDSYRSCPDGFNEHHIARNPELAVYWPLRHSLFVENGVIMYNDRAVIPTQPTWFLLFNLTFSTSGSIWHGKSCRYEWHHYIYS